MYRWRRPALRRAFGRSAQIVNLMLPRDVAVSDIQNEATIEAIAESLVISQL